MTCLHSSPTAYPVTDLAQPSRVYVSAVRYYLLCHDGPSHTTRHDRVTAALKGAERQQWQHRQQAAPTQCQRQAITQSDGQQLLTRIQRSHYCESDRCMLWAAFMTAFARLLSERGYCRLSPLRFEWPHSDPRSSLIHWDSDQHTTRDNEDLPTWHWGPSHLAAMVRQPALPCPSNAQVPRYPPHNANDVTAVHIPKWAISHSQRCELLDDESPRSGC